jgi:hypothetical protein
MKLGCSRLALVIAALAASGCQQTFPERAATLLRNADTLVLFSLEPFSGPSDPRGFHGWPVLGQVAIDKEDREAFVDAVIAGAASNDSKRALCFDPRHGIRAVSKAGTVDLVICFECSQVEVFYSGGSSDYFIPNSTLHETLSARLSKAGIPVAPTMSKRLKQVRQ